MKTVGVVIARHIDKALETARILIAWLESHALRCRVSDEVAERLNRRDLAASVDDLAQTDWVVVLGGDGSVLAAAREAASHGVPILPIDLGEFGFLSEVKPERLIEAMEKLRAGEYRMEERLMLLARVIRDGQEVKRHTGLNDAVITKGPISRLMHLRTMVNDQFVSDYPADGLIIATPTGSTAYSLSAGGPIIHPEVAVFIITPICAHTLFTRPLVVSAAETIRIQIQWTPQRQEEVMLTVDGQVGIELQPDDEVAISAAETPVRFIKVWEVGFYERLRQKLNWGGEL